MSQNQDSNNSGFVVSADTTNDQAWERLRDAVIQNAVLAYDMRDSAHDADFLSYLWASVERYKAALPARLRGKAPSEFEPGKGWRGSDGAFYRRPEQ